MSKKAYPLRIPEQLLELAEMKGKADRTDKATALRQLLYAGAEEYVLELLSEGRLALGKALELLELNIYDVQLLAQKSGVELGATGEQYEKARETARSLGGKLKQLAGSERHPPSD